MAPIFGSPVTTPMSSESCDVRWDQFLHLRPRRKRDVLTTV